MHVFLINEEQVREELDPRKRKVKKRKNEK
jgi:hypothetical protein